LSFENARQELINDMGEFSKLTEQFNKAREHHKLGAFGADRWISNLGWRLTHIKTKIAFLENREIPNGSLLRIPDEYDPSPVKLALQEKGFESVSAEVSMVPATYMSLEAETVRKVLKMVERLEEDDDVQNVYTNLDIPDDFEPEE